MGGELAGSVPSADDFLRAMWAALGGAPDALSAVRFVGDGALPSVYPVAELAAGSVAAAALAIAELAAQPSTGTPSVEVDRRRASLWFASSIRPQGWQLPPPWDAVAGDYRAADGWIRLHTNAPHHRAAALRVLAAEPDRAAVAGAVATWRVEALEHAVVEAGGCAAVMRTAAEWQQHPQGRSVATEPLVHRTPRPGDAPLGQPQDRARPLVGIRVLDLTRVLAGPVATRFLAGFGADVLRIDPPDWDEPSIVAEMTLGKRCARLDLHQWRDRQQLAGLLRQCDILVHGYRADALERVGFDAQERARLNPGLVDVSLNAYGWTGPWRNRRGFDSLVQMSAGIAASGMQLTGRDVPVPLPVQALDHATGYLLAAAAVRGLAARWATGAGSEVRASLARTARLLGPASGRQTTGTRVTESADDVSDHVEQTAWGPARRLRPPVQVDGVPMRWETAAQPLGTASAEWQSAAQR